MTVLVVIAHPDKNSFTQQWAKESIHGARNLEHEVLVSDLYEMKFDPIEKAAHYDFTYPKNQFDVLRTQEFHSQNNSLPKEVLTELEKINRCELIIFHFPIWWFSPPAALKGWMERVFVNGAAHDTTYRFDKGKLKNKRAQFCVTMGASKQESSFNGKEADIEMLLWPMAYTLKYLGMDVLPHKIINSVHSYHKDNKKIEIEKNLKSELQNQLSFIQNCQLAEPLKFNKDTDFSNDGVLKESALSHSPFIRHSK